MIAALGFIFILGPATQAAPPAPSKPVSVSYGAVTRCFPELTDERLSGLVSLSRLKEKIDGLSASSKLVLMERTLVLQDASSGKRRARLTVENPQARVPTYRVVTDRILVSGEVVPWESGLSASPRPEDLNRLIGRLAIETDDRLFYDTKLNGLELRIQRTLKEISEIRLIDSALKRTLRCEAKADIGVVCLCSQPEARTESTAEPKK